jgi:hypothetical protein
VPSYFGKGWGTERVTDLEVVHVEGGREHPAVVRPLLAAQADEPLALQLPHHGV